MSSGVFSSRSAAVARTGFGPMFVNAIAELSTDPFERRTIAVTPTVAQSCERRVNFRYDQPDGPSFGTRISVKTSWGPSTVSKTPVTNSPTGTVRSPSGPRMTTSASTAVSTAGKSAAGSACASEPAIVPR